MEERTDADLVALARANDTHAFELLIERYRLIAFYIAHRLVYDREIAQELLQEATLQAYLSLNQLRDAARFKNWFYRIIFNICSTWLREQKSPMLSLETLGEDWQDSGTEQYRNLDFQEGIQGWRKSQSLEFGRDTTIKRSNDTSVSLRSRVGQTRGNARASSTQKSSKSKF